MDQENVIRAFFTLEHGTDRKVFSLGRFEKYYDLLFCLGHFSWLYMTYSQRRETALDTVLSPVLSTVMIHTSAVRVRYWRSLKPAFTGRTKASCRSGLRDVPQMWEIGTVVLLIFFSSYMGKFCPPQAESGMIKYCSNDHTTHRAPSQNSRWEGFGCVPLHFQTTRVEHESENRTGRIFPFTVILNVISLLIGFPYLWQATLLFRTLIYVVLSELKSRRIVRRFFPFGNGTGRSSLWEFRKNFKSKFCSGGHFRWFYPNHSRERGTHQK